MIILDSVVKFTIQFLKSFHKGFGSKLKLSTTFHPQAERQGERTIQTVEGILRDCIIEFKRNCDDHLPLIEFAYNKNSYSSI